VADGRAPTLFQDRITVPHLSALLLVCALALFTGLGSAPLWEPDEPRFAAATREMLRSRDYLNPSFNGQPRWEKPIFVYWLQAASMRLGGSDELAARMPAAIAGTAAVVGVYFLALLWWSPQAGLIAAAGLATTFRFATYARQGLTDVPAVALIVLTFLAFEYATDRVRPYCRRWAWYAGWVLVGLTALTKGPLALIAPATWIAATWLRHRGAIVWRDVGVGIALAVVVGASWHAYMLTVHGTSFLNVNVGYELIQRYLDPSFSDRQRGMLFYWRILPGELAPWTLMVLAGACVLMWSWRSLTARAQHGVLLAVAWFAGVMLLCSFSRYKLPHYVLPAYPAALLLMGAAVDAVSASQRSRRAMEIALVATAVIFATAGLLAGLTSTRVPDIFRLGVAALGGVLVWGGLASVAAVRKGPSYASLVAALTVAIGYGATATFILPPLTAEAYPFPALGRDIARQVPPSVALSTIGAHTALVYYADRQVAFFQTPADVSRFLDSSAPRLSVLSSHDLDLVKQIHPRPLTVLASHPQRSPRLSHLIDGRFLQGTENIVLVSNAAAVQLVAHSR
jgi:4-amino-4-deoxy-L-arabinose transferase-like glycosyltransferase